MNTLSFRVAEALFSVHFRYDEVDGGRALLPSYAPFYVKEAAIKPTDKRLFSIEVSPDLQPFRGEGEELGEFDCGGIMHHVFRRDNGGYIMLVRNPEGEAACAFRSNADFSECQVSLFGDKENRGFGLGNALMIAFAFAGCYHNIVLIHASVPMVNGLAYCFLGKSGTGKSTHSRLWLKHIEGTDLLNDDNPAVRITESGEVRVYGTPWSGKTPCYRNLNYPAGGFLRLEQYPENIINKEAPLQAFASLLASCSSMIWDLPSYHAICAIVEKIVQRVPLCHLKCLPDEAAARLSYTTFKSAASC